MNMFCCSVGFDVWRLGCALIDVWVDGWASFVLEDDFVHLPFISVEMTISRSNELKTRLFIIFFVWGMNILQLWPIQCIWSVLSVWFVFNPNATTKYWSPLITMHNCSFMLFSECQFVFVCYRKGEWWAGLVTLFLPIISPFIFILYYFPLEWGVAPDDLPEFSLHQHNCVTNTNASLFVLFSLKVVLAGPEQQIVF